jgi:hypothetical protein
MVETSSFAGRCFGASYRHSTREVSPMTTTPADERGFSFRSVIPTLLFDVLAPYVTYTMVKAYVPGATEVGALLASGIVPAVYGVYAIIRARHVDIIGAVVLLGIAVSIAASFVGGDPKMLLIRESFVTGALGLLCLLSLLWPRPALFYVGRQFTAGQDPVKIEQFNALWQRPGARQVFRILTIVWGIGYVGEFLLRVVMVQMLSIPEMMAVGPLVFNGITIGLIAWTVAFTRHRRKLGEKADAEAAAAAAMADHSRTATARI